MRYWVQTQAPAGNWVDNMGTDNLFGGAGALSMAAYLQTTKGCTVRIVERVDTQVWPRACAHVYAPLDDFCIHCQTKLPSRK
jgi:hypothetical protein